MYPPPKRKKIYNSYDFLNYRIVAYLRRARTVTSKHVPTITQQLTKRCFLRAERSRTEPSRSWRRITSPRLLPGNSYKHLDDARVGKGHVTASVVTSRVATVTQQLKSFPLVRSRVYRNLQWEIAVSSREQTATEGSELEKS
jgi:hypothetical protein